MTKTQKQTEVQTITKREEELIPLSEWNNYYSFPSVGALRQLVFYNKAGFNKVVRKISGRLYIKVSDFNQWVEENGKIA